MDIPGSFSHSMALPHPNSPCWAVFTENKGSRIGLPFFVLGNGFFSGFGHLLTLAAQGMTSLNLLVNAPRFRKQKKLFKFSIFDHRTCIYRSGRMKTHSL